MRDADFTNSGATGSDDFSLLSDNWLTFSSCLCTMPASVGVPQTGVPQTSRSASDLVNTSGFDPRTHLLTRELRPDVAARVDKNRDGVFDAADVEAFEREHGLPNVLSQRMKR